MFRKNLIGFIAGVGVFLILVGCETRFPPLKTIPAEKLEKNNVVPKEKKKGVVPEKEKKFEKVMFATSLYDWWLLFLKIMYAYISEEFFVHLHPPPSRSFECLVTTYCW